MKIFFLKIIFFRKAADKLTAQAIEEINRAADLSRVKRESQDLATSEPKSKTNKKFLANTISHILSHNEREKNKHETKSTNKLKELERYQRLKLSKQKFGDRKHEYKKPEKSNISDDDDNER